MNAFGGELQELKYLRRREERFGAADRFSQFSFSFEGRKRSKCAVSITRGPRTRSSQVLISFWEGRQRAGKKKRGRTTRSERRRRRSQPQPHPAPSLPFPNFQLSNPTLLLSYTMVLTGTTFESSHPNGLSAGPGADVIKSIELFKVVSSSARSTQASRALLACINSFPQPF